MVRAEGQDEEGQRAGQLSADTAGDERHLESGKNFITIKHVYIGT